MPRSFEFVCPWTQDVTVLVSEALSRIVGHVVPLRYTARILAAMHVPLPPVYDDLVDDINALAAEGADSANATAMNFLMAEDWAILQQCSSSISIALRREDPHIRIVISYDNLEGATRAFQCASIFLPFAMERTFGELLLSLDDIKRSRNF